MIARSRYVHKKINSKSSANVLSSCSTFICEGRISAVGMDLEHFVLDAILSNSLLLPEGNATLLWPLPTWSSASTLCRGCLQNHLLACPNRCRIFPRHQNCLRPRRRRWRYLKNPRPRLLRTNRWNHHFRLELIHAHTVNQMHLGLQILVSCQKL